MTLYYVLSMGGQLLIPSIFSRIPQTELSVLLYTVNQYRDDDFMITSYVIMNKMSALHVAYRYRWLLMYINYFRKFISWSTTKTIRFSFNIRYLLENGPNITAVVLTLPSWMSFSIACVTDLKSFVKKMYSAISSGVASTLKYDDTGGGNCDFFCRILCICCLVSSGVLRLMSKQSVCVRPCSVYPPTTVPLYPADLQLRGRFSTKFVVPEDSCIFIIEIDSDSGPNKKNYPSELSISPTLEHPDQ
ncbi:hypothetical protein AGLY_009996 [Aphis glycines]|uniref:Uncharacterized protein n=1 Tax=Aphis glycines TaxID=307491 RepID=A0A6G0TGI9_APHGL|nr:hypothetical protein AGLY_009996 [Aphis glycines]